MAPAQKHLEVCEEPIHTQLKLRFITHENNVKNDVHSKNNNTVVKSGDSEVNTDPDFDIMKYEAMDFKAKIRWPDTIVQISLHLVTIYAACLILTNQVKLYTILFGKLLVLFIILIIGLNIFSNLKELQNTFKSYPILLYL